MPPAAHLGAGPFTHGVASGDPDTDRVAIWTRAVPADRRDGVELRWTVARDAELLDVVASGAARTHPDDDHTVTVEVDGLVAGTRYWYAFESRDGQRSAVGRFRTLPADPQRLRFALVSCAKFNAGFFNGYARIAERDDLQFVLHMGDYIYEAAQKPPASQTPGADIGRPFDPLNECVTLDDYRRRYAQYRGDPDTQAMHQAHAVTSTVDDHEFADGAWRGGSTEHKPERDGSWADRLATCFRVRQEWLPLRLPDRSDPTRVYRSVRFGGLAELFLLDTRSRRDEPSEAEIADPARTQLGVAQRDWIFEALDSSTARWRILGNSSVLGRTWVEKPSDRLLGGLVALKLMSPGGGPDPDQWDGYPAEREALLGRLDGGNTVVLSGDVHVGLAIDLRSTAEPGHVVAHEFVTGSLTSQNLDDKKGWGYRTESAEVERELLAALPDIRWAELDSHGYMVIDVDRDRVRVEWWFIDSVLERTPGQRLAMAMEVPFGGQSMVPTG